MSADSIQQTSVVYSTNSSISSSSSTLTNGIQIGRNFIRNQSIEEKPAHYIILILLPLPYFNKACSSPGSGGPRTLMA